jgi:hypothetical protein
MKSRTRHLTRAAPRAFISINFDDFFFLYHAEAPSLPGFILLKYPGFNL